MSEELDEKWLKEMRFCIGADVVIRPEYYEHASLLDCASNKVAAKAALAAERFGGTSAQIDGRIATARLAAALAIEIAYVCFHHPAGAFRHADENTAREEVRKMIYRSCDLIDWAELLVANYIPGRHATYDAVTLVRNVVILEDNEEKAAMIVAMTSPAARAYINSGEVLDADCDAARFITSFIDLRDHGFAPGDAILRAILS